MQHISIDYYHKPKMRWLSSELQWLFHLASITSHNETKRLIYGKIAEVSVRKC